MKIPFVGGYNEARSANASIQRTVNCYLEMDQGNPRVPVALYGTPGVTLRVTLGTSPVRGGIKMGSLCYWVGGNTVYKMDEDYAATSLGTIGTSSGEVGLATNGTQILLVDGAKGYIVTSSAVTEITDADFPSGVKRCAYQDGYFLVTGKDDSQSFWWNEVANEGSGWNGLDFASAEGSPDNTVGIISDHREVWLFGAETSEVWMNTGDADSLFQRSGNTYIEQGIAAAGTARAMNNTIYWLGNGKDGRGIVFRAEGYNPVRISTHALEQAMRGYSTIADAFAFTYQIDGHSFYVLVFPTADKTWFYDAATNEWFEWVWRDPSDNTEHRHRANCCVFFNEKHLVGDWETGEIYSLEMDVYDDAGDAILRQRVTQTMSEDGARLFFEELLIDMETGVGLASGQGSDPMLMLDYSNDNGHSWSTVKQKSMGLQGEYGRRVKFGPTGAARDRVWRIACTDPVKFALFGASARVSKGD